MGRVRAQAERQAQAEVERVQRDAAGYRGEAARQQAEANFLRQRLVSVDQELKEAKRQVPPAEALPLAGQIPLDSSSPLPHSHSCLVSPWRSSKC